MKLTKKRAILRHRKLWNWLADNPSKIIDVYGCTVTTDEERDFKPLINVNENKEY